MTPASLCAFLVASALSVASVASAGSIPLGSGAVLSGGDYNTGGGLTVAVEPRAIEGKFGLCGVWAQSRSMSIYTRNAAPRVLDKGVVLIGGQAVARDLNFLNRVGPAASYKGAPANCTVLNRPWSASDAAALSVRIPRQKVFLKSDTGRGFGARVFFTRSDSANPALNRGSFLPSSITSYTTGTSQY